MTAAAKPLRWNAFVVALHCLSAALILELIVHGWIMVHGRLSAATTFDLYQQHKSLGFLALALTAARLVGRLCFASPAALGSPLWERRLAAFVQGSLYALTIAAILAGWLVVSASPLPVPTLFFGLIAIPPLTAPNFSLLAAAETAHRLAAWAIAAAVLLHVAGALKHRFVDRDDVLRRMFFARANPR